MLTDPVVMKILENIFRLVASISEIKRTEDAASAERKDKHATNMKELVPTAEVF